jgi:hypothetical protein
LGEGLDDALIAKGTRKALDASAAPASRDTGGRGEVANLRWNLRVSL